MGWLGVLEERVGGRQSEGPFHVELQEYLLVRMLNACDDGVI